MVREEVVALTATIYNFDIELADADRASTSLWRFASPAIRRNPKSIW